MLLIDRKLWGLRCALLSLSVGSVALGLIGILALLGIADVRSDAVAPATLAGALALLVPIPFIVRAVGVRKRQPIDGIRDALIVDRPSNALRDRTGELLASLEDVHASMHIDWMTRGIARLVVIRWPGGRRVVFRSFRRKRALRALEIFAECGISGR